MYHVVSTGYDYDTGVDYYSETWNDKRGWSVESGDDIVLAEGGSITDIDAALKAPIPPSPDAFEPDDSMFQARLVTPNGDASLHSFYPEDDVDWVKFPVKTGYLYKAEAQSLGGGWIEGEIAFYNGDGDPIAWDSSFVAEESGFAYAQISAYYVDEWNSWYEFSLTEELPATISGTVTADDTDSPLPMVNVGLLRYYEDEGGWWDWTDGCETDADGRYEFSGVSAAEGPYRLEFDPWQYDGDYAGEYYDDSPSLNSAADIHVKAGETYSANAVLARAGRIAGTVVDDADGVPVSETCVQVLDVTGLSNYAMLSGYDVYQHADTAGQFNIGGLSPERSYLVRFVDHAEAYATEWYENAATAATATVVTVESGQTREINAALSLRPDVGHIKGHVTDRATDAPIEGIVVSLTSGVEGTSSYSSGYEVWTDANGDYRIGGLDATRAYNVRFSDSQSGYLTQYFNDKTDAASADSLVLVAGMFTCANARLDLDPSKGSISGTIRDAETLEPIPYAWVHTHTASGYYASGYDEDWHEGYADSRAGTPCAGLRRAPRTHSMRASSTTTVLLGSTTWMSTTTTSGTSRQPISLR